MPYSLSEIIVLFFTYSVVGWLWEMVYRSLKDGHYDYRGFLFGSYCSVYGFAIMTILICTYRVQDNISLLFIVGIIVASLFEFVASLFLEKVFHMILWDYSNLWGQHSRQSCTCDFAILGLWRRYFGKIRAAFYSKSDQLGRNEDAWCLGSDDCCRDGDRPCSYDYQC